MNNELLSPPGQTDFTVKYRVAVDREKCVGDGMCREKAPGTFGADDDGKTILLSQAGDPPRDIFNAAQCCRLDAISLFDVKTDKRLWP